MLASWRETRWGCTSGCKLPGGRSGGPEKTAVRLGPATTVPLSLPLPSQGGGAGGRRSDPPAQLLPRTGRRRSSFSGSRDVGVTGHLPHTACGLPQAPASDRRVSGGFCPPPELRCNGGQPPLGWWAVVSGTPPLTGLRSSAVTTQLVLGRLRGLWGTRGPHVCRHAGPRSRGPGESVSAPTSRPPPGSPPYRRLPPALWPAPCLPSGVHLHLRKHLQVADLLRQLGGSCLPRGPFCTGHGWVRRSSDGCSWGRSAPSWVVSGSLGGDVTYGRGR